MKKIMTILAVIGLFSTMAIYADDIQCTYGFSCAPYAEFHTAKLQGGYRTYIKAYNDTIQKNFGGYAGVASSNLGAKLKLVNMKIIPDGGNKKVTVICEYKENVKIKEEFDYLHCSEKDNEAHRMKPKAKVYFGKPCKDNGEIKVKATVTGNGHHF